MGRDCGVVPNKWKEHNKPGPNSPIATYPIKRTKAESLCRKRAFSKWNTQWWHRPIPEWNTHNESTWVRSVQGSPALPRCKPPTKTQTFQYRLFYCLRFRLSKQELFKNVSPPRPGEGELKPMASLPCLRMDGRRRSPQVAANVPVLALKQGSEPYTHKNTLAHILVQPFMYHQSFTNKVKIGEYLIQRRSVRGGQQGRWPRKETSPRCFIIPAIHIHYLQFEAVSLWVTAANAVTALIYGWSKFAQSSSTCRFCS